MKHLLSRLAPLAGAFLLVAAPALAAVQAEIVVDQDVLRGADEHGHILLYTPDPLEQGSSISHWDTSATPSLLMEPSITPDLLPLDLDVTPAQMRDIGWMTGGPSTITVFPVDAPGTGFDDPTPFPGAPGNPATTLGEARQNLLDAVIGAWADTLTSAVDIEVVALWTPLPCEAGLGAVLAGAGAFFVFRDDPGFPRDNTWFVSALAESFVGVDLSGPAPVDDDGFLNGDVFIVFNSLIDQECLGAGTGYYYGTDGMNPPNQVDLAPVVLHEFGHGVGFTNSPTDEATGTLIQGFPSIYDLFTFDMTLDKTWDEMTVEERVFSSTNTRGVVWNGDEVADVSADFLDPGTPFLDVTSPAEVAGRYPVGTASFGAPIPPAGIAGEIACYIDGISDPTIFNACSDEINTAELAGKIALIDRGTCTFAQKALNAQEAGAIAAIIVNNQGNTPNALGGTEPRVTIPTISLGAGHGNAIRAAACGEAAFAQGGRFQVSATFDTGEQTGVAQAMSLTDDTVYLTFFNPENVEIVVKVLNACTLEGFKNFWVFAAGLTNVGVELTVIDTRTGTPWEYIHMQGPPFPPVQDTQAFDTCP